MMENNGLTKFMFVLEGVGAVFVGVFLAAYLGGLFVVPQTTVFHSVFAVKMTLAILGGILLAMILIVALEAVLKRK